MKDFTNGKFCRNFTGALSDYDNTYDKDEKNNDDYDNNNDNNNDNDNNNNNCSDDYIRKKNNDVSNILTGDNYSGGDSRVCSATDGCTKNDSNQNNTAVNYDSDKNNNNGNDSNTPNTNTNTDTNKSRSNNKKNNPLQFDIVTGTPPYFPSKNGALPRDPGRGQCAFECRGGVETYVRACSRNISDNTYARFFVCQTYIELNRTERSVVDCEMQIMKRLDVYGRVGQKNPLFCVFAIRKLRKEEMRTSSDDRVNESGALEGEGSEWRRSKSERDNEDVNEGKGKGKGKDGEEEKEKEDIHDLKNEKKSNDEGINKLISEILNRTAPSPPVSVPYCVVPLYVRKVCGCHTAEYDVVMREMGRPLSTCMCVST